MTTEFNDRLEQLFHDVDELLGDVGNQVKDVALEVLDFKTHAFLNVEAFTEAKQRLNKLEMIYVKLKVTKEEYEEYYNSPYKVSN